MILEWFFSFQAFSIMNLFWISIQRESSLSPLRQPCWSAAFGANSNQASKLCKTFPVSQEFHWIIYNSVVETSTSCGVKGVGICKYAQRIGIISEYSSHSRTPFFWLDSGKITPKPNRATHIILPKEGFFCIQLKSVLSQYLAICLKLSSTIT